MLRRLTYFGIVVIWLVLMSFPILAFTLAIRGEIRIGNNFPSGIRVFLIQEDDVQGIGFEWSRKVNIQTDCSKTTVKYLLWEGAQGGLNADYCWCYDQTDEGPQFIGTCEEINE